MSWQARNDHKLQRITINNGKFFHRYNPKYQEYITRLIQTLHNAMIPPPAPPEEFREAKAVSLANELRLTISNIPFRYTSSEEKCGALSTVTWSFLHAFFKIFSEESKIEDQQTFQRSLADFQAQTLRGVVQHPLGSNADFQAVAPLNPQYPPGDTNCLKRKRMEEQPQGRCLPAEEQASNLLPSFANRQDGSAPGGITIKPSITRLQFPEEGSLYRVEEHIVLVLPVHIIGRPIPIGGGRCQTFQANPMYHTKSKTTGLMSWAPISENDPESEANRLFPVFMLDMGSSLRNAQPCHFQYVKLQELQAPMHHFGEKECLIEELWRESMSHLKNSTQYEIFVPSQVSASRRGRPPKVAPGSSTDGQYSVGTKAPGCNGPERLKDLPLKPEKRKYPYPVQDTESNSRKAQQCTAGSGTPIMTDYVTTNDSLSGSNSYPTFVGEASKSQLTDTRRTCDSTISQEGDDPPNEKANHGRRVLHGSTSPGSPGVINVQTIKQSQKIKS